MKRVLLLLCTLWAAVWVASCGSSNVTNVNPDLDNRATASFEVTTEEGLGTFTPNMAVTTTADGATVTLSAQNANDLAAAYLNLKYDTSRFTPVKVEFGDMLGSGSEVLTFALTDKAGTVPVGLCQVPSNGAEAVNGNGLLATVTFEAKPFSNKTSSAAPTAAINKVKDLSIVGQDQTSVTLRWTESHPGDTDNNGEVTLGDLTNIGRYLNQVVADASDPLAVGMADCNGDGTVTVNELTTLGQNFGSVLEGYKIFLDAAGTQAYNSGEMIERSNFWASGDPVAKNHPVVYIYIAQVSAASQPEFVVRPSTSSQPTADTPISNTAVSVVVDGAPEPPTNFNAISGDLIGNGKVRLTWTPSPTSDVVGYEVERKATNPDTPYAVIANLPASAASYVDSDPALTQQEYAYQIRAVDLTALYSDYAGPAATTPFFLPPPSPPANVAAVTHPTFGSAIKLTWDAPADDSAKKFQIYRQGPGEPNFTMVKKTINSSVRELNDVGLTALADYNYYVTSLGEGGTESAPSPTVTATASEEAAVTVTAFTTDKTTHCLDGSDGSISNLSVSTDVPADSLQFSGPGVFTTAQNGGTWKPNASTPLGKSTLTVIAKKGTRQSAPVTVDVYVTSQTIKKQYGNAGKADLSVAFPSLTVPNQPYKSLAQYNADDVVLYNEWGIWCYYCRMELPDFHQICEYYKDNNFQYLGINDSAETLGDMTTFYSTNGYTNFDSYTGLDTNWTSKYGHGGYPTSILIDHDGNIRLQDVGQLSGARLQKWSDCIGELCGKLPALDTP